MKTEATIDDLYNIPEHGKAELVHGEIVMMSPSGGLPGYAALEISSSLREYSRGRKGEYAIGDNLGFIVDLPHRKSFSPDAAYHVGPLSMKFITGAPRFAVEVRSEGDYGPAMEREIADKRADYFAAGTLVVWDVDLSSSDGVRVYRSDRREDAVIYRRGETAEAEPAVPGWRMPVDLLFPLEK
jgi:Uma2 family endonuclease